MLNLSSFKSGGEAAPDADVYDVVIIGGGPAGATAALYAARANLKTVVLDKNAAAGALAATSRIANYPGIPGVLTGMELLQTMREQAESFGARFVSAQVTSVDLKGAIKEVQAAGGPYRGRAVIVATGKMGRKNRVPGEEEFLGRGVSYCATCDAAFFQDRTVAVVGATEEAVDEALFLTQFASRVHVIAPGERFHADPDRVERLRSDPKVEIRHNQALRAVLGEDVVAAIRVAGRAGEETIPVDGVFIYLPGNAPIVDFLEGALELTEQGCIAVDHDRSTNVPGVYAVGDVVCSYIQQAVVAASDGAIAAMAAEKYIRGRQKVRSDWA